MKTKILFLILLFSPILSYAKVFEFIAESSQLEKHYFDTNAVLIASTGRSGSTLLTEAVFACEASQTVLKTHIHTLPRQFKGKILFIFSNPDKAAESVLHLTLRNAQWGQAHFNHIEGSDHDWLSKIGNTKNQSTADNLLSYDALRSHQQLREWLMNKQPCPPTIANILAIKYENLWDPETVENIKAFLTLDDFQLPVQRERGYSDKKLLPNEAFYRQRYNIGTAENPRYQAYDRAREIWESAPPFQYLHTVNLNKRSGKLSGQPQ